MSSDNDSNTQEGCFKMRINKTDNAMQIYNKNNVAKNENVDKANKVAEQQANQKAGVIKDKLEISSEAMEYQHAMKKLENVEDIRMEKVEKIKKQIEAGTYKIDGNKIAAKIIEGIEIDKKI